MASITVPDIEGNPIEVDGEFVSGIFVPSYRVTNWPATQLISAVSLPLPTGAATSANQTNGSQKAIMRGGAKGSTAAADVTSVTRGANHQALAMVMLDAAGDPITSFENNDLPMLIGTDLTNLRFWMQRKIVNADYVLETIISDVSAASAGNGIVDPLVLGYDWGIQLKYSAGTGTVNFLGTIDGTNFEPIQLLNSSNTLVGSATASGIFLPPDSARCLRRVRLTVASPSGLTLLGTLAKVIR